MNNAENFSFLSMMEAVLFYYYFKRKIKYITKKLIQFVKCLLKKKLILQIKTLILLRDQSLYPFFFWSFFSKEGKFIWIHCKSQSLLFTFSFLYFNFAFIAKYSWLFNEGFSQAQLNKMSLIFIVAVSL